MGGNHADGRGLFLFDERQRTFTGELLQHHSFGSGDGGGKIGQGSGRSAGMGGDRHGDIVAIQVPDTTSTFGGADTGRGGPLHELGNAGGA